MVFNWFNHLGVQKKMIISNLLIIIVPFVVLITSLSMLWGVIRYTNPVAHSKPPISDVLIINGVSYQFLLKRAYRLQGKKPA